jgi:hypothetical protein
MLAGERTMHLNGIIDPLKFCVNFILFMIYITLRYESF